MLPTPLLLGLRLTARRPGRAVLQARSTATTVIAIVALLTLYAQPERGYGLDGSSALSNLRGEYDRRLMVAVTILLIALAVVNTITLTWTTAMEARANMAIARTLGAPRTDHRGTVHRPAPGRPARRHHRRPSGHRPALALRRQECGGTPFLLAARRRTRDSPDDGGTHRPARTPGGPPPRGADPQRRNDVTGPAQQAPAAAALSGPRPAQPRRDLIRLTDGHPAHRCPDEFDLIDGKEPRSGI
ncbi:hypothetical protein [Streptosporangium roseum]|uniref:hypothetical protein n=1 Tax=Streptosporangium roseum TaxID=2001 RepID=UPI003318DC10